MKSKRKIRQLVVFLVLFCICNSTCGVESHLQKTVIPEKTNTTIVMFGDSITKGGKWDEILNRSNVFNEGLISDKTQGFILRLEDVYIHNPRIVFIMGGINDIASGFNVEYIFLNFKYIVEAFRSREIIPVIQSTLYSNKDTERFNSKVEKLNQRLSEYAKANQIDFIDLNKRLSKDKRLIKKYTFDGLHLRKKAYDVWTEELEVILDKYGL